MKKVKEFKYDVIQLIHGIRDRPCLWDKSMDNYKDRVDRRTAWEDIFRILDPTYDQMSPDKKRITGELILNKWTNIRDTFVRTLKTRMGKPKKKYLLYDHLKFLTKVTPETEINIEHSADEPLSFLKTESEKDKTSSRKRNKQMDDKVVSPKRSPAKDYDSSVELDLQSIDEINDPRIMNEDEAFFASLLPTVVKYDEDERLEFRLEVLAVMKNIKEKRKWSKNNLV